MIGLEEGFGREFKQKLINLESKFDIATKELRDQRSKPQRRLQFSAVNKRRLIELKKSPVCRNTQFNPSNFVKPFFVHFFAPRIFRSEVIRELQSELSRQENKIRLTLISPNTLSSQLIHNSGAHPTLSFPGYALEGKKRLRALCEKKEQNKQRVNAIKGWNLHGLSEEKRTSRWNLLRFPFSHRKYKPAHVASSCHAE